jgi:hypothetical protein
MLVVAVLGGSGLVLTGITWLVLARRSGCTWGRRRGELLAGLALVVVGATLATGGTLPRGPGYPLLAGVAYSALIAWAIWYALAPAPD